MLMSVITPTADRGHLLKGSYELLQNQRDVQWEWLIYDTSLRAEHFADPRVTYMHDEQIVSIGEKRNRLIEKASGDIIVHLDDDDYYSPTYLSFVASQLKNASFCTLQSWFSYDTKNHQLFYMDATVSSTTRYCVSPFAGGKVRELDLSGSEAQNQQISKLGQKGYGFSYAYTKEVAKAFKFQDLDFQEDRYFYEDVEAAGYSIKMASAEKGEAIHVIHDTNTSSEFPQYRIPPFLVQNLFPSFFTYIALYHEN